jgi:hypothetical protein
LFTIIPHYLATSTDSCLVSWSANIPKDNDGADIGGCAINDTPVAASSSAQKGPGTYTFECQTGTEYQIRTSKCEINPNVQEK